MDSFVLIKLYMGKWTAYVEIIILHKCQIVDWLCSDEIES